MAAGGRDAEVWSVVWFPRYPWFRSSPVADGNGAAPCGLPAADGNVAAPCGLPAADVKGAAGVAEEFTLGQAGAGATVQIRRICAESEQARRLREIGLIEGKVIHLLLPGDPLICRVGRCRVGLCRRLADAVRVRRVP